MPDLPYNPTEVFVKRLAKGGAKTIPVFGGLVEELLFGTMEEAQAAQAAAKLQSSLQAIQQQQEGQNTDLGDILLRLEKQQAFTAEIKESLDAIAAFLRGDENARLPDRVQRAAEELVKRHTSQPLTDTSDPEQVTDELSAALSLPAVISTPARFVAPVLAEDQRLTLLEALEGMNGLSITRIVQRLPNASRYVSTNLPSLERAQQLFNYAEDAAGPGLEELARVVRQLFPNLIFP